MNSKKSKIKIWSQVIEEQSLCEDILKLGNLKPSKNEVKRDVESYEYDYENGSTESKKKNRRKVKKRKSKIENASNEFDDNAQELISFDTNKSREHIKANEWDKDDIVVKEIIRQLNERNNELISKYLILVIINLINLQFLFSLVRCVRILGKKKCLELLYATQDIEDNGGILTEDGYRRKLPGGVFFQLLKNDPTILKEQKSNIFIEQKLKKKLKKQHKRLQNKRLNQIQSKKEETQDEQENVGLDDESINISMDNNCNIEEGEII